MKITELRLRNLNSLYGEWLIDFSHPEYRSNGIFALTGPTGAGKSTILDAVCLALYGATPRLGKITKGGNEIMSRNSGECYAEVVFESQRGAFRCRWEQRRAHRHAEGKLADAKHEISDARTGKLLETKKSLVGGVIEEKTGMDFARFTQSMLLAQGNFDIFLKADAEQKSKILEQITGAEMYSEISRRVHARRREEQERLKLLQAEASGISVIAPEQEEEARRELEEARAQEGERAVRAREMEEAIAWLVGIDGLKKEIDALSAEGERLRGEIDAFKPERERLERARRAAELDGDYATLTETRRQQASDQAERETTQRALPRMERAFAQQAEALQAAEQQSRAAKEEMRQAAPLIQRARALDQKLAERRAAIVSEEALCDKEAGEIASQQRRKLRQQEERAADSADARSAEAYLQQHARDEWLVGGLAGIEQQADNLLAMQTEIARKADDTKRAQAAVQQANEALGRRAKQREIRAEQLAQTTRALQQEEAAARAALGERPLREYRAEKEALLREMALTARIAELEEHRAALQDGKPCPLCGATEHPFAQRNAPQTDETEKRLETLTNLIQQAEQRETTIQELQRTESAARQELAESERAEAAAAAERRLADKSLSDIEADIKERTARRDQQREKLTRSLEERGHSLDAERGYSLDAERGYSLDTNNPATAIRHLKSALSAWQARANQKRDIEKRLAEMDGELKRLDAVIETRANALTERRGALEATKKEYADSRAERQKIYGEKQPDSEESRLRQAAADTEAAERRARAPHDDARQKLHTARDAIASLKQRLEQRSSKLQTIESDFASTLRRADFANEGAFRQARLAPAERDDLAAQTKRLDDRQTDLRARQTDRENRLSAEIAKSVTDTPLEELRPRLAKLEEQLRQLRETIATLRHRLAENASARARMRQKQTAIDRQKQECQRWEKLHHLIGSADGKKYRNFAQGLTFDLLVSHANRRLEKMTDRYLFIRDDTQPLELNVIDNHQAGEIRPIKNLSGGESFIASLALALGLSKMASQKVRVDSLFLDEGFGALDEEALETALEALSALQQDGKLIGIISHVSALKERIATQITVTPLSGGKSALAGPGCKRIARDK